MIVVPPLKAAGKHRFDKLLQFPYNRLCHFGFICLCSHKFLWFWQLVKTVLARCFEGWDNYHRLNTANAQLYRTNQRLEKVNERLTEENKILKAENKDYSLLRKVFGRKQIDDLLEQARTVKGRKRDNTRSR